MWLVLFPAPCSGSPLRYLNKKVLTGKFKVLSFLCEKSPFFFIFFFLLSSLPCNCLVSILFNFSGLLGTYLTLKELKKRSGRINWFLFYFHRFWRITPLYMVVLAIWATLMPYLGVGGGKDDFIEFSSDACQKYWWTNLLYISNLYPFPGNLNEQVSMVV